MSEDGGGGVRTAVVWADDKELLPQRIKTILGEFSAGPDDILHIAYASTEVGWTDWPVDGAPPGTTRRELRIEYSALLLLRA